MHLSPLLALSLALPALAAPTPKPKEEPTPVQHTGVFTLPADHKPYRPLIDGPPVDQLMEVPAPEPTKHCIPVPAVTFCDLTLGIFCTIYGRKPGECVEAPKPKGKNKPSNREVVRPPPQRTGSNLVNWDDGMVVPKELSGSVKLLKRRFLLPSERPASRPKVELDDRTHEGGDSPVQANGMSHMPVEKRKNKKSWWYRNVGWWSEKDW
jgi:hypothetical protein